jgi:hypothetical protein
MVLRFSRSIASFTTAVTHEMKVAREMSKRKRRNMAVALPVVSVIVSLLMASAAMAQDKKPNILVIMGDDIGMWNSCQMKVRSFPKPCRIVLYVSILVATLHGVDSPISHRKITSSAFDRT